MSISPGSEIGLSAMDFTNSGQEDEHISIIAVKDILHALYGEFDD